MDDDLVLTVKKRSETPDSPDSSNSNSPDHLIDNAGAQVREVSQVQKALKEEEKVTIATQTGIEEADKRFDVAKLSVDPHCYECKVKYRDPRPKDLVMFLHAWAYSVGFLKTLCSVFYSFIFTFGQINYLENKTKNRLRKVQY